MRPFSKRSACFACAALAALTLSGCGSSKNAPSEHEIITLPTAPQEVATTSPMELVEELSVVLEAGEIYTLDHYPNLKSVDLTGSTCYATILEYVQTHPQVDVTYTVDVGSAQIPGDAESAALPAKGLDFQRLLENLQYLPSLRSVSLPDIGLSAQEVAALAEAYPDVSFDYTVDLFGTSVSSGTENLDLSQLTSSQVEEAAAKLGLLPGLTEVRLSDSLTMTDVAKLQDANPNAVFHYNFTLFGQSLSTTDTEVKFKNESIGNEGEAQIRRALDILDNCERFVLDNCGLDNELLAQIREDYRGRTKVVWRVYFGVGSRYTYLTDAETIRTVYNVTDDTVGPLRYCEDAKYIDMGHNDYLTDLSFVAYMPNLEVFIGSGSAVKELVGFENCKKLTWLELANCLKLENIDVLEGCEGLKYLNLSNTKVKSYQALDYLPLERFMCVRPKAPKDERTMFEEIHEDCMTTWSGNVYGRGWRYNKNDKPFDYYENVIREVFELDKVDALIKNGAK